MIGSQHREISEYAAEIRRYLKSGNDVPITSVTMKAEELATLLDHLDSCLSDIEARWYDD
jgi:hypothetical protein